MQVTAKDIGFASWLELYKHIVMLELQDCPDIEIHMPVKEQLAGGEQSRPPVYMFTMIDIKLKVFEELYNGLPTADSLAVLYDLASEPPGERTYCTPLIDYFTNHPTRL